MAFSPGQTFLFCQGCTYKIDSESMHFDLRNNKLLADEYKQVMAYVLLSRCLGPTGGSMIR